MNQSVTSRRRRIAVVFCVHHKPWLIMSSLIATLAQESFDADLFFLYNVGDGRADQRDFGLASGFGVNPHLSPFDARVRDVCKVQLSNSYELDFENDDALDSGAWYKFIRSGRWRPYDYVFLFGEGTLFTRPNALSSIVEFAESRGIHFLASGHEKRRVPRSTMLQRHAVQVALAPSDVFHEEMIERTFSVFCRDPEFRCLFDGWGDERAPETQNHVPEVWPRGRLGYRAWNVMNAREAADGGLAGLAKRALIRLREPVLAADAVAASARVALNDFLPVGKGWQGPALRGADHSYVHVNGVRVALNDVVQTATHGGVRFHRVDEPEWFGCTVAHMMSRAFVDRLARKLEQYDLYSVLDIPYAATALEIIWGFIPVWMRTEKWFTDGIHRVRKHFVTYRREDDPATMAGHINRYQRGRVSAGPRGDFLKIRRVAHSLRWMKDVLPEAYF